jgi:hypothetical protein
MGYANTACICVWSSKKRRRRRRRRQTLKTGVVINAVQNMRRNGNECDKKRRFYYRHRHRRTRTEVKDYRQFRPKHSYAHETEKKVKKSKRKKRLVEDGKDEAE